MWKRVSELELRHVISEGNNVVSKERYDEQPREHESWRRRPNLASIVAKLNSDRAVLIRIEWDIQPYAALVGMNVYSILKEHVKARVVAPGGEQRNGSFREADNLYATLSKPTANELKHGRQLNTIAFYPLSKANITGNTWPHRISHSSMLRPRRPVCLIHRLCRLSLSPQIEEGHDNRLRLGLKLTLREQVNRRIEACCR